MPDRENAPSLAVQFAEFTGEFRTRMDAHDETLSKLEHSIVGNGKPGLSTRVEILERTVATLTKTLTRVLWTVVTPLLTALSAAVVVAIGCYVGVAKRDAAAAMVPLPRPIQVDVRNENGH